ncbi:MAG: DNA polymerase III subunit delta [Rhodospirillaceae bacterium]|jgi:DNA polymerase III subunit delta|nr:DNA polymerase III subunit delta [Rhodospirillaceae bacterium]MBT6427031.1 DNA polymerase III subunit delta [Rhodospirillaceae bacterium]MBT7756411.1 DNA polymerase III subunit delta [Rhodospirillaceae bacterium]
MVKLQNRVVESFLDAPGPEIVAALLYGEDSGLVRERAARLAGAVVEDVSDPFRVAEVSQAMLKDDPSRLFDEMAAMSLTGGRRLVRLSPAGNAQSAAIQTVLDDSSITPDGSFLVVEAGSLAPRDSLRKLFESHQRGAAIPCYLDDDRSLEALIHQAMSGHGLTVEPSALAYLCENLGSDRQITRSELEKLALFKGRNGGAVTLAEAEANVGDGAPLARDDVALATASGDQGALDRALVKCNIAGEQPIAILRAVIRHLQRLHLISLKAAMGDDIGRLIKSHRPPIFFKHQAIMQRQIQMWRPQRLAQALAILTEAELDCKTTGLPAEAICGRALIRIANAAQPKQRG